MANVFMLIAIAIFVVTIIVAISTDNSWRNVGITWGLLTIGIVFFGITLTL
jgi:hypothetical protein